MKYVGYSWSSCTWWNTRPWYSYFPPCNIVYRLILLFNLSYVNVGIRTFICVPTKDLYCSHQYLVRYVFSFCAIRFARSIALLLFLYLTSRLYPPLQGWGVRCILHHEEETRNILPTPHPCNEGCSLLTSSRDIGIGGVWCVLHPEEERRRGGVANSLSC